MQCQPPDRPVAGPFAGSVTDDDTRRRTDHSEQNNTGPPMGLLVLVTIVWTEAIAPIARTAVFASLVIIHIGVVFCEP